MWPRDTAGCSEQAERSGSGQSPGRAQNKTKKGDKSNFCLDAFSFRLMSPQKLDLSPFFDGRGPSLDGSRHLFFSRLEADKKTRISSVG